ncbi:MAG: hypothetical protein P4L51_05770 [Puia sp.]|nr:hypothetical protein [Puia sp.]
MRITRYCLLLLSFFLSRTLLSTAAGKPVRPSPGERIVYRQNGLVFEWDLRQDDARLIRQATGSVVWQGSLLPSFWLLVNHHNEFVKASLAGTGGDGTPETGHRTSETGNGILETGNGTSETANGTRLELPLRIGRLGRGRLVIDREDWGIRFSSFSIEWAVPPPAIIEMYFGASDKILKASLVLPGWDRPFLPDWQSFGYCVPGAKEGPAQSYFRNWDFGLTNIALGSFGPSMGVPYGAAYPKPLYFAGMGSDEGFIALGAGAIPDAAMSLRVQATRGCFQYVYDEDSWGSLSSRARTWAEPLRISFGTTAFEAFKNYYRSFPVRSPAPVYAPAAFFNTWGLWREKKYTIAPIAAFARSLGASLLVLDDGWESSQGSGTPFGKRFPDLNADLAAVHDSGMTHGLWETLGWIDDTAAAGLTAADLIVGKDGKPVKANWNFDPSSTSYFCLDISSAKTREFLRQRTLREMHTLKPSLIKLDFGYGFPPPGMGVPRNPLYRGERQYAEILRLIATTAKSADPSVKIMYYGISPLAIEAVDIVSLDDQGDLWYDIAGGHGEWSIWASLLSDRGVAVAGSSGYSWEPDDEVILNTAIIGCPGASLPIAQPNGQPIPEKYLNRRLAIDKFFRRSILWQPVWLNSLTGNFNGPPRLNCWGRMEKIGDDTVLTALALRDAVRPSRPQDPPAQLPIPGMAGAYWKGRWALISQDDKDILSTPRLALIPFDPGEIVIPCPAKPAAITRLSMTGETLYDRWEWNNGLLKVDMPEDILAKTAGLLVRKNN